MWSDADDVTHARLAAAVDGVGHLSEGWGWDDCCCCYYEWLGLGCTASPSLMTSLRVLGQIGERSLPSSLFIVHVGAVLSFI